MNLKPIAALTAGAALIATAALAQTQNPVTDPIVAELEAAGYTRIEVETEADGYEIEAWSELGEIERYYSLDGLLLREEVEANGVEIERVFDANGNIISETIDNDRDDDDDDYDGDDD